MPALSLRYLPAQADAPADRLKLDEHHIMRLERPAKLRRRRPMDVVPAALEIADRAARNLGLLGKFGLRPVEKSARRTAEFGRQIYAIRCLTHRSRLPILVDISHIWHY